MEGTDPPQTETKKTEYERSNDNGPADAGKDRPRQAGMGIRANKQGDLRDARRQGMQRPGLVKHARLPQVNPRGYADDS